VARTILLRDGAGEHRVTLTGTGEVELADGVRVRIETAADGTIRIGAPVAGTAWTAVAGDVRWVFLDGETYRFEVVKDGPRRKATGHQGSLMAPMPATVVRVQAAAGDTVKRGDTLIILEAMKMELPVRAPADGTVTAVHCVPGQLVQPGVALIDIDGTEKP
jgi:3-methylcrotonyl-CoA carboxylase alpha subunit